MFSQLGIIDFSHYLIAVIAVILLPGPNSIFVLRSSIKYGIRRGYHAAMGVFIGDGLIMFAVYLGVAALINESPQLFNAMRYFSAGFLFYLACQIIYGTYFAKSDPSNDQSNNQKKSDNKEENLFLKAITLSLTNPKALLFFFAFFHKFIDPSFSPTYLPFLILSLVLTLVSFLYLSTLIIGGASLINFIQKRQWLGIVGNSFVALLFTGFSIQLILA